MFKQVMNVFMTDHCYNNFVLDFNFLDGPCLTALISKLLGYSIVAGSVLVKLPQIIKIISAKSSVGLSFTSLLLEIYAVTTFLAYSLAKDFPFSTWGDAFFLMLQNIFMGAAIQHYNGKTGTGAAFVLMYMTVLFVLLSGFIPLSVLSALQASQMPAVVISKLIQALDNFKNGPTGQLSAVTVFLIFLGSIARIFTSIQETGDKLVVVNYIVSSVSNGIIAFQIVWYWNVIKAKKE
uniref:Mannose-P-dolichol utilization defect 1 protein homolog n=1 Tax=Ciona savignyi TaxID=51511 RepID=H2Y6B6_CIOSA